MTLADDFSESSPDTHLWNVGGDGAGYTYALANGGLELTIPADAQTGGTYNMVGPGWGTQCRFNGDFDARVDYRLIEWRAAAGVHLQLNGWIFPNVNSATAARSTSTATSTPETSASTGRSSTRAT